jgi:hypothetical protein
MSAVLMKLLDVVAATNWTPIMRNFMAVGMSPADEALTISDRLRFELQPMRHWG